MTASLGEATAVNDMLATLEGSARQIDKLIQGMSLVAVQTNMLAVSGSVEARVPESLGADLRSSQATSEIYRGSRPKTPIA